MPAQIDITLIGDKAIQAVFKGLPRKLQGKILRSAMRTAGRIVLDAARARAPVESGELKASLKLRALKGRKKIGVQVVTGEGFFKGDQFYGGFVELGTRDRPAQPFLRPALHENESRVLQTVEAEMRSGIDRL